MSVLDHTHEVLNQAPPLVDYNVFEADLALREGLEREGGGWGVDRARDLGAVAGSAEVQEHSGNRLLPMPIMPAWALTIGPRPENQAHASSPFPCATR